MINLDLKINSCPVDLSPAISREIIKKASLRKDSFLDGLHLRFPREIRLYWAKNPTISCFGEKYLLIPVLSPPVSDTIFGTSAFLYFDSVRNELVRIGFQ